MRKYRDKFKRFPTLNELADKYGTDKGWLHGYTETIYPQYLDPIRNLPISFLEIGVLYGDSLKMWDEYFTHPQANLVAWDIEWKEVPKRFKFRQVDCMKLDQVIANALPFDVVVDDGAHNPKSIKVSLEGLWSKLNRGGLYIVEDVRFSRHLDTVAMFTHLPDRSEIHVYGEVIVVRKM